LRAKANVLRSQLGADNPEIRELLARVTALRRPAVDAARRIHDFHKQSVQQVAAELPTATAQRLTDYFNERAYRPFFPDACDLRQLFHAVDGLALSPEQIQSVATLRADWSSVTAAARERMLQLYLNWSEQIWLNLGYAHLDHGVYAQEMQRLSEARTEKSKTTMRNLAEMLSDQQNEEIQLEVNRVLVAFDKFHRKQQVALSRFNGWPGPYD
jgi:hypothetical protein